MATFTIEVDYDDDEGENLVGVAAAFCDILAEQVGVYGVSVYDGSVTTVLHRGESWMAGWKDMICGRE